MKKIELTPAEMLLAGQVGLMRQVQNLRNGRQDRFGCDPGSGWQVHIEGACGEFAVAKFLGVFWSGNLSFLKAADVGSIQVRTSSENHHRLILHDSDPSDARFVLVTGRAPSYTLRGWVTGSDGKRKENWSDPAGGRPAYFVPHSSLHDMEDLL